MAINAGLEILGFDGFQHYDYDTESWQGMSSVVTYPPGQSFATDPPLAGSVVIEETGAAWRVVSVETVDPITATVRLELKQYDGPTTEARSPATGSTKRGAIVQPVNGFIGPYWDALVVDPITSRVANVLNMASMSDVWKGDVDLGGA